MSTNSDFDEVILEVVKHRAKKGECEASCEEHRGSVRAVRVERWGFFSYCEEAVAEDGRRGLTVTEVV